VKVTEVPEQIAPEGLAKIPRVVGAVELTSTETVPCKLVQPFTVAVTLYVPAIAKVDGAVDGF
jgi:hypothetical protein